MRMSVRQGRTGAMPLVPSTNSINRNRMNAEQHMTTDADVDIDVSDLEPDDSFERMMFQQERDERRLKNLGSAGGSQQQSQQQPQAFRKAQHRSLGLTVANLDRHSLSHTSAEPHLPPNPQRPSPPSSVGSARSDPHIHAPSSWGRKGRTSRNWMRSALYDDHRPRPDSPLSYREAPEPHLQQGHHQQIQPDHAYENESNASENWDLTFELNEASLIASTPYVPRNPALDDIRAREDENMQSPSMRSRPRSSHSQAPPSFGPLSKSVETIGSVERPVVAAEPAPGRTTNSREHAMNLMRRLSRTKDTPSPRAAATTATATAKSATVAVTEPPASLPASPPSLPLHKPLALPPVPSLPPPQPPRPVSPDPEKEPGPERQTESQPEPQPEVEPKSESVPQPHPARQVDATPLPARTLYAKTPVVTGAWVDTPGPRTVARSNPPQSQHRSRSPEKSILRPSRSVEPETIEESPEEPDVELPARMPPPQLPVSALQSVIQQARATGHDYGNDTITSLEGLLTPPPENADVEDDTLQGLDVPTNPPRTQAERERQKEARDLRNMRETLRRASIGLRDLNRGMRRVETSFENAGEEKTAPTPAPAQGSTCHCHNFSLWHWSRSFVWDAGLKQRRATAPPICRIWGGLTGLGILLTILLVWWLSEEVACEFLCQPLYAISTPYPFGIKPNAPKYPYVIPTMIYRALFASWSSSLSSLLTPLSYVISSPISWAALALQHGGALWGSPLSTPPTSTMSHASVVDVPVSVQYEEDESALDWSMARDEVVR